MVGLVSRYRLVWKKLWRRIQNRLNKFIDDNSDINECLDNGIRFASDYRILLHKNAEEYEQKRIDRGRLITCLLVMACFLVSLVRFTWTAIFPDQHTSGILAYPFEPIFTQTDGNITKMSKILASYGFSQLVIGVLLWQMTEFQHNNSVLEFMFDFQKHKIVPLNHSNSRKVGFIMTMMTKVFLCRPLLHTIMVVPALILFMLNIIAYHNSPADHYILSIVILNLICIPCLISVISFLPLLDCVVVFVLLYLRCKMKEIDDKFCVYSDLKNLFYVQILREHNTICKYIMDINKLAKWAVYALYYMIQPSYIVLLVIAQSNEIRPFFKYIAYIIFLIIFTLILLATRYVSRISELSRQPLKVLFRLMSENKLTLEERLKTMTYIERLMGPDIGFYCLDWFPMNSYEFYLFVVDCAKNYLLFRDFSIRLTLV